METPTAAVMLRAMDKLFSPTLAVHIGCGFLLVAVGLAPILTRKGSRLHRWSGRTLVGLMSVLLAAAWVEARLDPRVFARAHRSALVNLAHVREAQPLSDGSWRLTLASGADVVTSRSYRQDVLRRLGR